MKGRAERDIQQIVGTNRPLRRLLAAASAFGQLDERLQQSLPASMRGHIRLACIEEDTLVLAAASPAWASRARVLADQLRTVVGQELERDPVRTRVVVMPLP